MDIDIQSNQSSSVDAAVAYQYPSSSRCSFSLTFRRHTSINTSMAITRSSSFLVYAAAIVFLGQSATVSAADFSPGGADPFGLGRLPLPLPNRRGGLAETMSEALDELRETRVELTALREEMRSIQRMKKASSSAVATVADASSAEADHDGGDVAETEASAAAAGPAPIERTSRRRRPYGLGLTPVSG